MNDKENKNNEKWIVLTNNIVTSIFFYFEWFFKHTLGVKAVMFFLCIVEYGSIIIILIFLYKFKSFNRIIGKPDESLGRKATGPLKWQPAAWNEVYCLFGSVFYDIIS